PSSSMDEFLIDCPGYDSESPDELALVQGAARMGRMFYGTSGLDTLNIRKMINRFEYTIESWKVLAVIPFNSTRKRMSVLYLSPTNEYILFCKGADSVMTQLTDLKSNSDLL